MATSTLTHKLPSPEPGFKLCVAISASRDMLRASLLVMMPAEVFWFRPLSVVDSTRTLVFQPSCRAVVTVTGKLRAGHRHSGVHRHNYVPLGREVKTLDDSSVDRSESRPLRPEPRIISNENACLRQTDKQKGSLALRTPAAADGATAEHAVSHQAWLTCCVSSVCCAEAGETLGRGMMQCHHEASSTRLGPPATPANEAGTQWALTSQSSHLLSCCEGLC